MNAGNRALWIVMSLLLIGLGTVGVLAHYGRLPGTDPDLPLLSPNARERWTSWGTWAMVATIVAGLVLAVLGVVLMRAQLRRRGRADMPDLELRAERAVLAANAPTWPTNAPISPTDRAEPQATGDLAASQPTADPAAGSEPGGGGARRVAGTLRVEAGALRHALAADLRHQRGVERADVRLTGDADDPHLRVWLTIDPNADLTQLRDRVVAVVDRFTVTAGRPAMVDEVTVRVPSRPPARVR
ncbi:hypothetical protein GCM10009682_26090 [Luedemannella flava]|uniref:Alkaline shock response membrane anchor protein AmaP n=1 Tax=Luedemannella flava TaxID=349316 RepID=A0ABP4Y8T8_9ACTN